MIGVATGSAVLANVLTEQWTNLLSQGGVPPVFLDEKLWTSGIITVLAAFLLWQSWAREIQLRKETHERENRMAVRIDNLETSHTSDLRQVIESVNSIENVSEQVDRVLEMMAANCQACEIRREAIFNKLDNFKNG